MEVAVTIASRLYVRRTSRHPMPFQWCQIQLEARVSKQNSHGSDNTQDCWQRFIITSTKLLRCAKVSLQNLQAIKGILQLSPVYDDRKCHGSDSRGPFRGPRRSPALPQAITHLERGGLTSDKCVWVVVHLWNDMCIFSSVSCSGLRSPKGTVFETGREARTPHM